MPINFKPLPTGIKFTPDTGDGDTTSTELDNQYEEARKSGFIMPDEIQAISSKYGVSEDLLKQWIPRYAGEEYRGTTEPSEEVTTALPKALGRVGQSIFLGVPQWLTKKFDLESDEERQAVDELRELVESKKTGADIAADIGLGLLSPAPLAKAAGTGFRAAAATGLSSGAIYGLAQSREGEELPGATSSALLGLAISPVIPAVGKAGKYLAGKVVTRAAGEETPTLLPQELRSDLLTRAEEAVSQKYPVGKDPIQLDLGKLRTAPKKIQADALQFARYLAGSADEDITSIIAAEKLIKDRAASGDKEFLGEQLKQFRILTEANKELARRVDLRRGVDNKSLESRSRLLDFFRDSRYVLSDIDKRIGTTTELVADELSNAHNLSTHLQGDILTRLSPLARETRKSGLSSEDIIREIETAAPDSNEISEIAQRWRGIFSDYRNKINTINKNLAGDTTAEMIPAYRGIRDRKTGGRVPIGYVPKKAVRGTEFILRMESARDAAEETAGRKFSGMSSKELGDWISQARSGKLGSDSKDFLRALEIVLPGSPQIRKPRDFRIALDTALSLEKSGKALRLNAGSLQKREDALPEFIRETDLAKLLDGWGNEMGKEVYLRRPIEKLRAQEALLRKRGLSEEADYVGNLITDTIMGPHRGFAGSTRKFFNELELWGSRVDPNDSILTSAIKPMAANAAKVMTLGSANMYPYFLGLRPDAVLRNLTQPFLMTATEIAPVYGQKLALKGQIDTLRALAKGESYTRILQATGRVPDKFRGEMTDHIREGMLRDPGMRKMAQREGKKALDKLADAAMIGYTWSDSHNRAVTYSMSRILSADYLRGLRKQSRRMPLSGDEKAAISSIRNFPRSYQVRINRAIDSGEVDQAGELVADYLLGKTQFNYNRTAMSDYGRKMGSLFSMFSKWPTSMVADVSDIGYSLVGKGPTSREAAIQKAVSRYMMPVAAALALENALFSDLREEDPQKYRNILGGNVITATPLSSLDPFISGDFGQPPILSVPGSIFSTVMGSKWDKLPGKAADGIASVTPGGILWKAYRRYFEEPEE